MKKYPLLRFSNIVTLNKVIQEDEFDDAAKAEYTGCVISYVYAAFVLRNLVGEAVLDLGCGSGGSFGILPITCAADANFRRASEAERRGSDRSVTVKVAAAEALPFGEGSITTVLYMHGFFQCRSDYEVLMEVNRVLKLGGRFIFDFPLPTRTNLEFGRILEPRSYVRILKDFGFELVELRELDGWEYGIAVEKYEDFDYRRLKKIQLVERESGLFEVKNLKEDDYTIR